MPTSHHVILLTGGTGYIGGKILDTLQGTDHVVRCLVRHPDRLPSMLGANIQVVVGDVRNRDILADALDGVDTAYFLIHSMSYEADYKDVDRQIAHDFGEAARIAGVHRIIYLGGLGHDDEDLSAHLRSRHEVGAILRASGVQVIEFRTSVVIGSGSLSFEMIRALVERLPIMITPKWVSVLTQPIAIEDVLKYLLTALDVKIEESRIIEIGGADRVTYGDMMRAYGRQRGLKRVMIPVPFLTPRLSSLWLALVTPINARVGRKLIDGLKNPTVVEDESALELFDIRPKGVIAAIEDAFRWEDELLGDSSWPEKLLPPSGISGLGGFHFGTMLIDTRIVEVCVPPSAAFKPIRQIGGETGWYSYKFLWWLRGTLDRMVRGVGMRCGRRAPDDLMIGDIVDCWHVDKYEPNRRLRLAAEMRLPGRAWLDFIVKGDEHRSTIRQSAIFDPLGLTGLAYWYLIYPLHSLVFSRMINKIAESSLETKCQD